MSEPLRLSEEVRDALDGGRPVVALETSVLAQGLPPPRNLEAANAMEVAIRQRRAVPAWIAIDAGVMRVGLPDADIARLAGGEPAIKVARRDIALAVASGALGATTVSATLWAADRSGIEVMSTGGIGGVHRRSGDVSADLAELARTPGLVVCSGPKSIVDPVATLERLEELGVAVVGYRCDRLPFFIVRDAGSPVEHRVDSASGAAAVARARSNLGMGSAILLCNPIDEEHALPAGMVADAVAECEAQAERERISGKDVTPFLLSCLVERTGGASLEANLALLAANAALAAEVAGYLAAG
ncbi:MAG: pseudouridine-5'-phosphate glycosidase [Actinomycetota bacterium]